MEGVAPQALLVLPLGRELDRGQLDRQLEGELARGRNAPDGPTSAVLDLLTPSRFPAGAMGRGV